MTIELFKLGEEVGFHHRAAVARIAPLYFGCKTNGWVLFEGVGRHEMKNDDEPFGDLLRHQFYEYPRNGRINKSVFIWPEIGSGFIMGKVRRSIGSSWSAYKGNSYFGDDGEPGGHITEMYVNLYVIKQKYNGTDYILTPLWATNELRDL